MGADVTRYLRVMRNLRKEVNWRCIAVIQADGYKDIRMKRNWTESRSRRESAQRLCHAV